MYTVVELVCYVLVLYFSKHAFRDELEGFRRDIEIVRSRVCKYRLVYVLQINTLQFLSHRIFYRISES